ncbi:Prepilin signal peptidase PulO (type II secretory pathway) or related peptidase, partial [Mycobacterium numidiamassiliense]
VPRMRIAIGGLLLAWLTALSCYDVRQRRLPNLLTLTGAAVILLAAVVAGRDLPALAGAVALAGVYLIVHLVAPADMGAGDVKLALGLGGLAGCFGVEAWFLAALAAPLLTALCGVVGLMRGVRTVPHGPSMCLATAVAVGPAFCA